VPDDVTIIRHMIIRYILHDSSSQSIMILSSWFTMCTQLPNKQLNWSLL